MLTIKSFDKNLDSSILSFIIPQTKRSRMFTRYDKIKELVMFFSANPCLTCNVYKNKSFAPVGFSVVMTHKYRVNEIEIIYNKWFVESFELAKQMNLPGCDHHDKLVKGSGVFVSTKNLGTTIFYGRDAQDIVDAYEAGYNVQPFAIKNIKQK